MKKIITLIIAAGAFMAVQAQTTRDEARRVVLGQEKKNSSSNEGRDVILGRGNNGTNHPGSYPNNYPAGSRQSEIDRVNRSYDAKIWSIRNNNRLSRAEKDRMIRQLEKDRAKRIREINQGRSGYGKKGKRYGKNDDRGKHLGWEKGRGNPHKYGGKPGKRKG
jgi:hypothetical protein